MGALAASLGPQGSDNEVRAESDSGEPPLRLMSLNGAQGATAVFSDAVNQNPEAFGPTFISMISETGATTTDVLGTGNGYTNILFNTLDWSKDDGDGHMPALVGKHLSGGPGVVGDSHTSISGAASGARDGSAGVLGRGRTGVRGESNPFYEGDGVIGQGLTGVRGIAKESQWIGTPTADGVGYTGVLGEAEGAFADGIRGVNPDGDGVHGEGHTGVRGESEDGDGVLGEGRTGVRGDGETGVRGVARENGQDGVRGEGRTGVRGVAREEDGEDGVLGEGETGVRGVARDAGEGVRGDSPQGDGIRGRGRTGVRGIARDDVDETPGEERAGVIGEAQGQEADGVRGDNPDGDGIHGEGRTGVRGRSSTEDGEGVRGENTRGDGIRGEGRTGVRGESTRTDGYGVRGENREGIGVQGRGQVGIRGIASRDGGEEGERPLPVRPTAIEAIADEDGSIGIEARAEREGTTALRVESTREDAVALDVRVPEGGTAIHIRGAACFETVGVGVFASNSRSATIDDRRVTDQSFIYTMLTGDPSTGNSPSRVAVSWVERHPRSGFTVHLDGQVNAETPFSYFIVEPCPPDEEHTEH